MASLKSNPFDVQWVKSNSTEETISEREPIEQTAEEQRNADKKTARPWRVMCISVTIICVIAFILVNEAWMYSVYYRPECVRCDTHSSSKAIFPEEHSLDSNDFENIGGDKQMFVQRSQWRAVEVRNTTDILPESLPLHYMIVSQTFTNHCASLARCTFQMRAIQRVNMMRQALDDIMFNFLIGGDGRIYVGRGWNKVGSYASDYDARSIGVSFIGTYDDTSPSLAQLSALQFLTEVGIASGKLAPDFKLVAHRQIGNNSADPGNALYDAIKMLLHWSPNP